MKIKKQPLLKVIVRNKYVSDIIKIKKQKIWMMILNDLFLNFL